MHDFGKAEKIQYTKMICYMRLKWCNSVMIRDLFRFSFTGGSEFLRKIRSSRSFVFFLIWMFLCQDLAAQSLMTFTTEEGEIRPVRTLHDWQSRRTQILDGMQALMGPLPEEINLPPFKDGARSLPEMDVKFRDSLDTRFYTRYDISFTVAVNEEVTAYLYLPKTDGRRSKSPAVLALHETDMMGKGSVDGQSYNLNLAYAKELAQRGYVVLAPDYPSFGDQADYDFTTDRYDSGMMKAVFNHIRCVDYLQSRGDVDPERIGIIGHSLGGHSSMYVAAFDTRIKVIVSSCGWT